MAFSTILIVVGVLYVFIYAGLIGYDLFIKKDPAELLPTVEDEEVDISDEVGQFQPILIDKDAKPGDKNKVHPTGNAQEESGNKDAGNGESKNGNNIIPPKTEEVADCNINAADNAHMDEEASNRRSLSDMEPREADGESKKRIDELVRQKRLEMEKGDSQYGDVTTSLAESPDAKSGQSATEDAEKSGTAKTGKPETGKSKPPTSAANNAGTGEREDGKASETSAKPSDKGQRRRTAKKDIPLQPWMMEPENPIDTPPVYESMRVRIDKDDQHTKQCDGRTAESVSKELKSLSIDEIRKLTASTDGLWEMSDGPRELTEDEQNAIDKAASEDPGEIPTFRRSG